MKRLFGTSLAILAMLVLFALPCAAAKFPQRAITVNVVFGPGGGADLGMRVVADFAGKNGMAMNVVNKPAGGGSQAALDTLSARPDGHAVLFASTSLITLSLTQSPGYVMSDFTPVANISNMPLTFSVLSSSGIKTFQEWMDRAKAEPGKFSYGSPGPMSAQRMFIETLVKEKFPDVRVSHVPYASGHEANTALLGGQIQAAFGVPGTHKSYLQSGEFTMLAVTSVERLPEYPDVPTFRELFGDRYVWESYHGLLVNSKTPKNVVDALANMVEAALKDPEVLERFDKIGITANFMNPKDFAARLETLTVFIKDSLANLK